MLSDKSSYKTQFYLKTLEQAVSMDKVKVYKSCNEEETVI